jgi:hypothetical protein
VHRRAHVTDRDQVRQAGRKEHMRLVPRQLQWNGPSIRSLPAQVNDHSKFGSSHFFRQLGEAGLPVHCFQLPGKSSPRQCVCTRRQSRKLAGALAPRE